jgi:staphylococcal nuclease domain-containing protein 1
VVSGARLRLYIPKETARCTVLLAGISAPRTAFRDNAGDPYADESKQFMTSTCLQHDVDVEVFDSDRNGNLVGSVFLKNGTSLGDTLVEEGLAKMHFSASRYGNEGSLSAAEAIAKAAKKNVWSSWDPSQDVPREARSPDGPKDRVKSYKPVLITHIKDATTFYAQYTGDSEKLESVGKLLN